MGKWRRRFLLGCGGLLVATAVAVAAVPFTRTLVVGLIQGEPVGEDLRPLGYHVARLNDPDPSVRTEAMSRISGLGEKAAPAAPALLELANDPARADALISRLGDTSQRVL